ncbi:hypothetical protein ABTX81_30625 [Kitasatospora sp. NPDC097605]|uniref:hypothetical protein n=1 Tax=Kitasatospora sp. NPDC097605 TaxID=3157226 RepID=UPI0033319847
MPPKTTTTTPTAGTVDPEPPAAAVAADAHWAATLEKLRNRKLAEKVLRLWDDSELKRAFNDIEARAAEAALLAAADPADKVRRAAAVAAEATLADAVKGADAVTIKLRFRALPGDAFVKLIEEHPPTPEQLDKDSDTEWNPETFPPVLIAAASVDGITEEQAQGFMTTWGHRDRQDLFSAALAPQVDRRGDLGKG